MKAARCSCIKQEVTGNRVQVPSGPATVMVKHFSIQVTRIERGRQKRQLMIQSQETYLACVTKPFAERSGVR